MLPRRTPVVVESEINVLEQPMKQDIDKSEEAVPSETLTTISRLGGIQVHVRGSSGLQVVHGTGSDSASRIGTVC